jgi:iron complex outermembrane receptor protein
VSDTLTKGSSAPVIVTGKRLPGKDATATPTVVDGAQLRATARTTPLEALAQESADIYITSRGAGLHGVASGASGGIYIRGLGGSPNSQVLVVENNAPDYQGIFGHPIPDAFMPALIERTYVIKGGDGVLYGTNALGGVIVIENRRPKADGWAMENDLALGEFNTFRTRVSLLGRHGRTETAAAVGAFTTAGHRDGTAGNSLTLQGTIRRQLNDTWALSVGEKALHLQGGDPGPSASPYLDHWFDVYRNNLAGSLDGQLLSLASRTTLWCNAGIHRLYDGFYSRDYVTGGCTELTRGLGERAVLLGGASVEHVDGHVADRIDGTIEPVRGTSGAALYGQATLHPGHGVEAVGGGRAHFSSKYGYVPLYKAGLRWHKFPGVALHTRLTRNFRQPTLRELYLPYPTANPDLKPEYAVNWDGGVELAYARFKLSSGLYRTWSHNMIKYFGVWPSAEVVNIDRLVIRGYEGSCSAERVGPFSLKFSACRQNVGRFTKQNPNAKADFTVSWDGILPRGATCRVDLTGEWVGGIYMNNYGRDPLDNVFFMDCSVRFGLRSGSGLKLAPYLLIRNILDSHYEFIEDYPMPGLHVLAGLTTGG